MSGKILRFFAAVICVVTLMSLTGCSPMESSDFFLSPPAATGDMFLIEKTLKSNIDGMYTLKYPTSGEYRSAYILTDILNTGKKDFALAFYSVTGTDNVSTMHLNLMKEVDGNWVEYSDVSISAVGVEKVELCDLDGDGAKEIVVGWNIYSNVEKKVSVYSIQGKTLSSHTQEAYTEFLCCDLNGDKKNGLLIISHITDKNVAVAKLLSFDESGTAVDGSCKLNGAVTSFSAPVFSKLPNGTPAVYIDSTLTNGTQTDIIYYKDGVLINPTYITVPGTTSISFRSSAVAINDINSDGCMDIPLSVPPAFENRTDSGVSVFNFTEWCNFDGSNMIIAVNAVMNYIDGCYIEIPDRWMNKITVENRPSERTYSVILWTGTDNKQASELVRFKTISESEWDKSDNGYSSYTEITRNNGSVYAAMPGIYSGYEAIKADEIRSIFHVIS